MVWNSFTMGTLAEVMASTLETPGIFLILEARSSNTSRLFIESVL